jgi:methionyl-tRNA formyltransferase
MNPHDLKIVFLGTPEFAVASLRALVDAGYNIVGVVTAPDKPGGRGMQLQQSAIKKYAAEKKLKILQPEKLKNSQFLAELKSLVADLQVVVAFRMLPEAVWNMPPQGTINVHGSLLPQYRGAAPINWAIINGEKETGITTFKLKHEIDTGDILLQEKILIGDDEIAGELHDRMKEIGAQLLVRTVEGLADGSLKETPQLAIDNGQLTMDNGQLAIDNRQSAMKNSASPFTIHHSPLKHAPKIFTDTCRINWNKPVDEVYNLIRGLSPYPAAFTEFEEKKLKIFRAKKEKIETNIPVGGFETDKKTFLKFACDDGYILAEEIQLEGKKKMLVEDFLRGYRFTTGV